MDRTVSRLAALAFISTLGFVAGAAPAGAGDLQVDGSLVSTAATGTPPLAVSSTTKVDNLNADLLDGLDSSDLFTAATDGSGSGLDADLLDGLDSSALARALGNVVRVGATGGDFASIQAALDSITTASAANPFLVLVGPGVFSERVVMKPFVDIQGSGEGVTKVTQSGSTEPDFGTVAGADDAELRFLTVENTGGSDGVIGVYNAGTSPRLVHVTVEVETGAGTNAYGVLNQAATGVPTAPELTRVTVRVERTGGSGAHLGVINQVEANARLSHVRVEVSGTTSGVRYGVFNSDAAPLLHDVEVSAGSSETSASVFGVVNQDADGAVLRSVRVAVTGGGTRYGVNNTRSDVTIRDLEVSVSGDGDTSYGVFNEDGTVVLESCSVSSLGGASTTAGVFNADASGALRDCTVTAAGGGGVETAVQGFASAGGAFTYDVQHSRLEGADAAVNAPGAYTVRAGASQLAGGVSGAATYACVHAYDGSFAALGAACV